jgi:hypothetical protein
MSSTVADDVLRWPQQSRTEKGVEYPKPESSIDNEPDMPTRRTTGETEYDDGEERRDFRRAMTALAVAQTQVIASPNGNKKTTYFMAAFAAITLLGTTANFLTSSGIMIGGKGKELETLQKQADKTEAELGYLRTWNEKLRNNMAAYGWLIDSEGNVSRIEDKQRRK